MRLRARPNSAAQGRIGGFQVVLQCVNVHQAGDGNAVFLEDHHVAVYVDPASPHGIASSVASLLADEPNRRRLTKMGHERVERFSWDSAAAATAQILRQAAGLPATGDDEYRV